MLDRLHNLLLRLGFTEYGTSETHTYYNLSDGDPTLCLRYENEGEIDLEFEPEPLAHLLDRVERLEKALEQATEDLHLVHVPIDGPIPDAIAEKDKANGRWRGLTAIVTSDGYALGFKQVEKALGQYLAEREAAK